MGIFTVRSAYKLASEAELCSENSGEWRKKFMEEYLECPSPAESSCLRVEAKHGIVWPVQSKKQRRNIVSSPVCEICGNCKEDSFHATVACTKALALRTELRKHWILPPEKEFVQNGPDWLLLLLQQ